MVQIRNHRFSTTTLKDASKASLAKKETPSVAMTDDEMVWTKHHVQLAHKQQAQRNAAIHFHADFACRHLGAARRANAAFAGERRGQASGANVV